MDKQKEFMQMLSDIIEEAENSYETIKETENLQEINVSENKSIKEKSGAEVKRKNVHEGHRQRVKASIDKDPDYNTLSDHEILEFILFATIPRINTNEIAHELINHFGSYAGVLNATVNELKKLPYINDNTARMLTCIIPAARRAEISRLRRNVFLDSSLRAVNYLYPYFMNRNIELLYLACLDNNDRVISVELISSGSVNFTTFDVKNIVECVCRHCAAKVIIAHNHPAGTLNPSISDEDATARVALALSSIGILLVDHIVFTSERYYSFCANDKIEYIYDECDKRLGTSLAQELRARKKFSPADKYLLTNKNMIKEEKEEKDLYLNDEYEILKMNIRNMGLEEK